jgi:2-haloacid dehalogenase
MTTTRREFLSVSVASAAIGVLCDVPDIPAAEVRTKPQIKAIAFDAFPLFNPASIFALGEKLFPGKGADLANEWRTRQFEYAWLHVVARRYVDFWQVTQDALIFAAEKLSLNLDQQNRHQLMDAYLAMRSWPDVIPSLNALKNSGLRLAILSNLTQKMLDANLEYAGLKGKFEHVLTTDQVQTYKPDPKAYEMGVEALGLKREEILFVAHAGWDAAGAKLFGYPTFWVNRQQLPMEQLGATPDAQGESLLDLVKYLS